MPHTTASEGIRGSLNRRKKRFPVLLFFALSLLFFLSTSFIVLDSLLGLSQDLGFIFSSIFSG